VNQKIFYTENLTIGHNNKPIIEDINLDSEKSNLICIVGRNGIGKSTFLNTLSGILKPISGKIFYNNKNFSTLSMSEKSTLISYVPSQQEYLSNLTVYDLVSMGRSPYTNIFDKHSDKDDEIINNALKEFNLEGLKHKSLHETSDGERQRTMICRAIVQETPIILLDEPTAFLDYYTKQKLLHNLSELSKTKKKCIIFSSHDLDISLKHSDLIWLFHENKIQSFSENELKQSQLLDEIMNFKFHQNKIS
jgi:iron complex transport system ATP-binding protein